MLIELEEPFKSKWEKGYRYINGDERHCISLSGKSPNTTLTYARYLMCIKLGYILPTELEVDHIDDDKTNDDIDNLQVLTKEQNLLKQHYHYIMNEQICYGYICACCEMPFILTEREVKMRLAQNVELAFCSNKCARIYNPPPINHGITEEEILRIRNMKRNNGLSSYKISEITGFARNTVMKYW